MGRITHEQERAIALKTVRNYQDYLKQRKAFENQRGIIQPLRAVVKVYDKETFTFEQFWRDSVKLANIKNDCCEHLVRSNVTVAWKELVRRLKLFWTTVGYVTACATDTEAGTRLDFGVSICTPEDFLSFQKFHGRQLALHKRVSVVASTSNGFREELKALDNGLRCSYITHRGESAFIIDDDATNDNKLITYNFPITINQQLGYFFDRCARYYFKGE